ncbi:bifunctional oligoribonuclease/PAP phosphatase NrnA [Corynebacterium sp.]|uniref:DHH family phosphoesterase n=1 Tax=Corynebacterium sp. TaxID=1720 RepID=UPI0026DC56B1|nr:bifunctional oligoribonuclease/PAP phosphatase NrnA [Corynebacterium sp.]MDO5075753.1 bifunctional oligoribonuclease/PAP phosphatase NrnA [Corynebacterium sp.]
MEWGAAAEFISGADRIAVVGHIRPDADAIGSVCAMVLALEALGKDVVGVIGEAQKFSENLLSIPAADRIRQVEALPEVDAVITVDCATVDRAGECGAGIARHPNVLVVDHHASNPGFGHVNLIDIDAESTTTILAELIARLGVELTPGIAHALYAGLATDTGSFRWGRPAMHELAARLMRAGVDARQVAIDLLDVRRVPDVVLLGRVLSQLQVERAGEFSLGVVYADYHTIHDFPVNSVEGIVEFVRALAGVDIGVVFKEYTPHTWAVSLRSTAMNVADIATALGGGGHVLAAGYTAFGTADDVLAQLTHYLEAL